MENQQINQENWDVFISYAWANKKEVIEIVKFLKRSLPNLKIWRDDRKGEIGQNHWKKINNAIAHSRFVLVMHSDAYLCSRSCYREWKLAEEYHIPRIPILLKDYDFTKSFVAEEMEKQQILYCVFNTRSSREQLIDMLSKKCKTPIGMLSYKINGVSFDMKRIAHKDLSTDICFNMGSTEEEPNYYGNELPQHTEQFKEFFMAETPVTQALWHAVLGGECPTKEDCNKPKVNITYDDCKEFIEKLNKLTDVTFRIPYENEWEFAACGENTETQLASAYAGHKHINIVAWYARNSKKELHPVKQKKANAFGLYDMSGNVWEWCKNRYYDYPIGEAKHPIKVEHINSTTDRIIRGGSYASSQRDCRVHRRNRMNPSDKSPYVGLRLAMWLPTQV